MEQQIYLIGLNYRTAGVEVRERFALTDHCSKDTWAIPLRPSGENDSAETTLDEALG
jgi:glutamyl-tRNA reductase